MDETKLKQHIQTTVGLAALLNLLEEKGIITEAEYAQKYKEGVAAVRDLIMKDMENVFRL